MADHSGVHMSPARPHRIRHGFSLLLAFTVGSSQAQDALDDSAAGRASAVLATSEFAATHCPELKLNEDALQAVLAPAKLSRDVLREREDFLRQTLALNALLDTYDHQTLCTMVSRQHAGDVDGLLSSE
jgi:hypothetical protein